VWAELQQAEGKRQNPESVTADNPQHATRNASSPRSARHSRLSCVRLWFADNGVGIPKEAQERIFKMFQRLDKSYDGTGVGLTVVRKAVEKMGGRVGLESEPGQGSRFWLELKVAGKPKPSGKMEGPRR
jgi:signal transduction histidine kinase